MPKYLVEASYTHDGIKGIQSRGGSTRREAVDQLVQSVGGTVECLYFAFGDVDLFVIIDVPDDEAATAVALTFNASGGVRTKTTPLIDPAQVDAAAQRSLDYRPPGS